jgi:DNA-binding transcriptional LysR family regulator
MLEQVLNHTVDIGVVAGPIDCAEVNQQDVFEEELVLVTELGHREVTTAADVGPATILSFRAGCAYRYRLEQWFAESGIRPKIVEFGAFETILACVGAGMGVSLMPVALLIKRNLLSSVRTHTLPRRLARVKTALVWRRDISRHAARDAFIASFAAQSDVPASTH